MIALLSLLLVAAAPVELGSLRLTSVPGAEVEWEGIPLGKTNADGVLLIRDIPPGDYTLTLSRAGYRTSTRSLTVVSGETVLSLGLERSQPPSATAPPKPPPPSPPETSRQREPAPPAQTRAVPEAPREGAVGPSPSEVVETPPAVAELPPQVPAAAAASGRSSSLVPMLLALLVAAVAFLLLVSRSARQRATSKGRRASRPRPPRRPVPVPPAPSGDPPGFLEDLQRREERVESGDPEIIDVIDVEIVDDEL